MRGEQYPQKVMDLGNFLTAVVYPALSTNLDKAFPEFKFRRRRDGTWVAETAPVHYTGYGHRQGKLVATAWGFRSLTTGAPFVMWLSYLNKGVFPRGSAFVQSVAKLAAKVRVTFKWDPKPEEVRQAEIQERRDHFLEAFLAFAQGELSGELGKYARAYLSRNVGLPPNRLTDLDLGYYPSPEEVRRAMHDSGYETEEDDNLAEVLGLYHPKWEGRIVGPWWDLNGRSILNLWGRLPGETPVDQSVFVNLNRPGHRELFGSKDIPIQLHEAQKQGRKNLVLLESPVKALLATSLGLVDPFPISTGGPIAKPQVATLCEYLKRNGSLTINMDYDPASTDIHAGTCRVLETMGEVPFQVFVVDPVEMAGKGGHPKSVDPASYIRSKGIQSYKALLSKRTPARHYRGHAMVRMYNPTDHKTEDTPKDVTGAIEDFVGSIEEKRRSPELDRLFHETVLDPNTDLDPDLVGVLPDSDSPDEEFVPPDPSSSRPRAAKATSVDTLLREAKSLVGILGPERTAEFLQSQLSGLLLEEVGGGLTPPEEAGTRVRPPAGGAGTNPSGPLPRNLEKLAANIQKGFEGIARGVNAGEVSPRDAIGILLHCQAGIQTLLTSLQERMGLDRDSSSDSP